MCCTFRGARSGFVGGLALYWLLSEPIESLEQRFAFLLVSGLWGAAFGSIIGTWIGAWLNAYRNRSFRVQAQLLIILLGGTVLFLMIL